MLYQFKKLPFLAIAAVLSLSGASAVLAALPDRDTYNFTVRRYTLPLENLRSGCTYYANPDSLHVDGNVRFISVLLERNREGGGSMCNGVFRFEVLSVRCQTQEVSYSERIGSPANWEEKWYRQETTANKVCEIGY